MSTTKKDQDIDEDAALTNLSTTNIINNLAHTSTSQTHSSDVLIDDPPSMTEENLSASRDQPSATYEAEDAVEEPVTSHWYRLTTAQKNRCRQRIASWLGENYMAAPGVRLLVELVYQHYCLFCGKYTQSMPISQVVFERILTENYPNVTMKEEQVGRRPRKYFFYFIDLDILESSEEFETVRKGRKVSADLSTRKRLVKKPDDHHTAKRKKDKPGSPPQVAPTVSEKQPADNTGVQNEGTSAGRVTWLHLEAAQKDAHREATAGWLEAEYEADSNVCVPRTAVFSHYLCHCEQLHAVPAPQAIFGRIIQKTFPRILMRRLGVRGESKYYYMGLDIRASSDHHEAVSTGKVLSMGIKPKSNRLYLHTKT